jgi:hypothetical protein
MFDELENIELAEEVFGTNFPIDLTEDLKVNSAREVVDYFVLHLKGWGPNPFAARFLKQLATKHKRPALAQGLHDNWRREQISAVVQEIFDIGDRSGGGDDAPLIPAKKPGGPDSDTRASAQSLDDDNS